MKFNLKKAFDKTSPTDAGKILIKATCLGPITTMTRQIQLKMQVRDVATNKTSETDTDCAKNKYISSKLTDGSASNDIVLK